MCLIFAAAQSPPTWTQTEAHENELLRVHAATTRSTHPHTCAYAHKHTRRERPTSGARKEKAHTWRTSGRDVTQRERERVQDVREGPTSTPPPPRQPLFVHSTLHRNTQVPSILASYFSHACFCVHARQQAVTFSPRLSPSFLNSALAPYPLPMSQPHGLALSLARTHTVLHLKPYTQMAPRSKTRTEGAILPSSSPRGDRRSQYYASLSVLWCVRLSAWLLGAYLVRVGFSVDSLKLYIAMSVFLAIAFNVLPDGQAPTAPPPAKAADRPTRPGATHQDKTGASPSQRTQPSEVCEADVGCHSDAPTPRTPPLSLVERVRLGNMMRVLGTPGAMRCVTDASFRALMLEKGAELPRDDACPCGSGETFQRCCYAVPQTLKDWANSVD